MWRYREAALMLGPDKVNELLDSVFKGTRAGAPEELRPENAYPELQGFYPEAPESRYGRYRHRY